MKKQRVLLVCSHHLFGESVENVLRQAADVELLEPLDLMQQDICLRLPVLRPDAVVIVEELPDTPAVSLLTAGILQQFPNLPVFRADLSENIFHVFAAHTLPARSSDLVEALGPDVPSEVRAVARGLVARPLPSAPGAGVGSRDRRHRSPVRRGGALRGVALPG